MACGWRHKPLQNTRSGPGSLGPGLMEWRLETQAERLVSRGRGSGYRSEPPGEVPLGEGLNASEADFARMIALPAMSDGCSSVNTSY